MKCGKCGGLMVNEDFQASNTCYRGFHAYRCISCGRIIDTVIIENEKGNAERRRKADSD